MKLGKKDLAVRNLFTSGSGKSDGATPSTRGVRSKMTYFEKQSVRELKLPSNIAVCIRVYANIKGLASAYFFNKVLERQDDLSMFIRGFNMGHPMCDFVDAGDGKVCADAKLKAPVGDNLEKDRIVLIEGPPFAKELAVLRDSFIVARFPDVFRTTKLPARRVSFTTTPPRTPVPPTYAATIGRAVDAVKIYEANVPSVTADIRKRYTVMQNSRVRLDENGIASRRLSLRYTPCPSKLHCKDEKCLLGHQCPDKGCIKGNGCRSKKEMHNVDRS
ncbi:uncharacterized protein RSE6_00870 [Rhynchosporium secalis]|uniref:Uncharacterized protein n=1 Tax=Rhynchosporium secalis TaxID=38038 RepID=A0A1E1LWB1_RHYSE|nr:uncharacterized protein RSE6_00870 [Rhynchosporium secalis]